MLRRLKGEQYNGKNPFKKMKRVVYKWYFAYRERNFNGFFTKGHDLSALRANFCFQRNFAYRELSINGELY